MKYKAVIYDMDGTVLDTLSDLTDSVNHSLSHFNLPEQNAAKVRASLGNGAARLIALCAPADVPEDTYTALLEYYKEYYDAHCLIKTAPYEGIVPMMERLKSAGVKQAILSNKPHSAVKPLAEHFFGGLVEFALGESETVHRKPDPSGLINSAKALGFEVSECLYVGDSEVDIATAKNAGMDCAAVCWGFRDRDELEKSGALLLAENCAELEAIITE